MAGELGMEMQAVTVAARSFSIVVETENLAQANVAELLTAMDCLAGQGAEVAQEVLLIDSGDVPESVKRTLLDRYDWLTICQAPPGISYYGAKMLGAERSTGEILVFYDSDCLYEPGWLDVMRRSFDDPAVQVVAGETRTRGIGVYGTAMALAYIFPQYSGDDLRSVGDHRGLQRGSQYYLNNVAFRREFLLTQPIPVDLPLYRGNCVVHAKQLVRDGVVIWRQPAARATHAPPNGWRHFYQRFLLIGYDYYWQGRVLREFGLDSAAVGQERDDPTRSGWASKLKVLDDRVGKLIRSNPWHLLFMPLAIPVIAVAVGLIVVGYQITVRRPNFLLKRFDRG
jgi:cellulose synthase/poly-beta-1,6-N-acetylglucosamine synthase-like glycosyltransferase